MARNGDRRDLARALRRFATPVERHVWRLVRGRRFLGLKFRRQHPIAGFVVDFACLEQRLALELDGGHHRTPQQLAYDVHRDAILRARGYTVIRVPNGELSQARLERIVRAALPNLALRPPSPATGEGDRG